MVKHRFAALTPWKATAPPWLDERIDALLQAPLPAALDLLHALECEVMRHRLDYAPAAASPA
ncbi:MAG: hypothetical protein C0505_14270 [Leptothrix sp. (in: Bacteria)]|nr:hypothetical protein [Leptothrix sp. (in: b-proteobacteria)]